MTKHRIVIEIDLCIQSDQAVVLREQKRIDLQQRRIHFFVSVVKRQHEFGSLIYKIVWNGQAEGELAGLEWTQSDRWVDRFLQDQLGGLLSNLFDIHTARRRGHENIAGRDRKSTRLNSSH